MPILSWQKMAAWMDEKLQHQFAAVISIIVSQALIRIHFTTQGIA